MVQTPKAFFSGRPPRFSSHRIPALASYPTLTNLKLKRGGFHYNQPAKRKVAKLEVAALWAVGAAPLQRRLSELVREEQFVSETAPDRCIPDHDVL
jgi:hypothetical protein